MEKPEKYGGPLTENFIWRKRTFTQYLFITLNLPEELLGAALNASLLAGSGKLGFTLTLGLGGVILVWLFSGFDGKFNPLEGKAAGGGINPVKK